MSNRQNDLIQNAMNHWYNARVTRENTPNYYRFIRESPVVSFKNNANAIHFLRKFKLKLTNNNSYGAAILKQLPKHRMFYIMVTEPFRPKFGYGNLGIRGIPSMVKAGNQNKYRTGYPEPNTYGNIGRLGLVNKELMNRYLTKRSLNEPNKLSKGATLRQIAATVRASNILFKQIKHKRNELARLGLTGPNRKEKAKAIITKRVRHLINKPSNTPGTYVGRGYRNSMNRLKRKNNN